MLYSKIKFGFLLFLIILIPLICNAQTESTISGTVKSKSGEAIISASVYITNENSTKPIKGAYTNKFGFFSIPKVPAGKYIIVASSITYNQYRQPITVVSKQNLTLQIELDPKDIKLDEVVVEGDKEDLSATNRIGTFTVDPIFISKMPAIFGEIDVFRTLQLLPGVQTSSEISSGLYVRGGSPDQNLCLLDGVIVYNPAHFGGFFSVFNTDALKDIKLIKGCFPAEYGGRLSSVLDMTMKEGSKEKFSGDAMISLISSKLTVEGPITEDVSFMISGRRMYFDIFMNLFLSEEDKKETPSYYFYDLNAKINYKISDNDHLFISGFFVRDVLDAPIDADQMGSIYWGNKTANIRWMRIFSPTVFTNFSMIYTDYSFNADIELDRKRNEYFRSISKIRDLTVRAEAQIFPIDKHIIKTGIDITNHNFIAGANVEFGDEFNLEDSLEFLGTKTIDAIEAAYYIQDDWTITEKLSSNIGVRLFYFDKGKYFDIEPRISFAYKLDETSSLKTAFATTNQFVHLIVRNDITLPTDLWFPSTESIKPSKSHQIMFGYEKYLFNKEYYFTVETYYKKMYNLYEYKDGASFSLGLPLETQFTKGEGDAYGIEFFLNKQIGNFSGWIGYTLAWTNRTFAELNYGKSFPPRYDRRHDISVVLSYKFNEKWEIGASWVYATGQAYTMPTGVYAFNNSPFNFGGYDYNQIYYQYSDRNGMRLPSFHKLDLNLMYKSTFFSLPSVFSINVYNAYNRRNPFAWYIADEYKNYEFVTVVKQVTLFPIIPSVGYSVKF